MTAWHFICHVLGVDVNGYGTWSWNAFWGGSGSDITVIGAILTGAGAWVRKWNCEKHGCWRIGRHVTDGGHLVCRHHHPEGAPSAEKIAADHWAAKGTGAP